jgi:hypothetical protein
MCRLIFVTGLIWLACAAIGSAQEGEKHPAQPSPLAPLRKQLRGEQEKNALPDWIREMNARRPGNGWGGPGSAPWMPGMPRGQRPVDSLTPCKPLMPQL